MRYRCNLRLGCAALFLAVAGCAGKSQSSEYPVEASVCGHMWSMVDRKEPRWTGTATSVNATICLPELVEHRRAIGDEAFEREVECALSATNSDVLKRCMIGPPQEPRELCEQMIKLQVQYIDPKPSQDLVAQAFDECVRAASIWRLTYDPAMWRMHFECARVATTTQAFLACDDEAPQP